MDLFKNIGEAVGAFDRYFLRPGYYMREQKQKERRELIERQRLMQEIEMAPPGLREKLLINYFNKHQPEVMKQVSAGDFLPTEEYGTTPWYLNPDLRKKFPEEAEIGAGTKPRAVDPWINLGRMAEAEANLGVDELSGKSRFPALTKEINRQIRDYSLPGMTKTQSPELKKSLLDWWVELDELDKEPPSDVFRKTGEGTAPGATKGQDKNYGKPQIKTGRLQKAGVEGIGSELKKAYFPTGTLIDKTRPQKYPPAPTKPAEFNPNVKPKAGQMLKVPPRPTDSQEQENWYKVFNVWSNLPASVQWEIWRAMENGWSWEDIASSLEKEKNAKSE